MTDTRPDVILIMTDEERAAPPYESDELRDWRHRELAGQRWFDEHAVSFGRHYTGSLACVPSRPTLFTGQYPDVHGVTQTDGLGKMWDDSRMRWLRPGEVPTLGHWFRAAGYDTHYDGKWHISHADLTDPATGRALATNDAHGTVDPAAVQAYLDADPLDEFGFSGWVGPEPHGAAAGQRRAAARPADRRPGRGLARGPLRPPPGRRRRRDATVPARRQLREPPRHRALPRLGPPRHPAEPRPPTPPPVPPAPTADEDLATKPAAQIAYRNAYPSAYGPAPADRAGLPGQRPAVPGPLLPAARRGGRTARPGTPGRHRRRIRPRRAGSHLRPRRPAGRPRRPPPEVVQPLRRGHAGAVPDRSHRRPGDRRRAGRRTWPRRHVDVVPTLLSAAGIDATAVQAELAERFSEVHPLPGRDLTGVVDGTEPPDRRPGRLPAHPRRHARGRHRRLRRGPGPGHDREPTGAAADPAAGARGDQRRGNRHHGGRRRRRRGRGPPVEARAHLRRPRHLDRTRTFGTSLPPAPAARPTGPIRCPISGSSTT